MNGGRVAKRSIVLAQAPKSFSLVGLAQRANLARQNLHRTVAALADATGAVALEVKRADKDMDDMYNAVFRALIAYMPGPRVARGSARTL